MSGTALDPSIPLNAGKGIAPPVNALTQMGQIMQLRALQNQNALFPGQQQIQQQTITNNDISNQNAQLGLTRAQNTAVNGFLGPAVAKGGDATLDDYTTALARAHAAGYDVSGALADLHATPPDGASLATWGRTRLGSGLSPAELVQTFGDSAATRDSGGQIINGAVGGILSGHSGQFTPVGTPTDLTVAPSQAAAPETRVGADGKPVTAPAGAFMPPAAVPPQLRTQAPSSTPSQGTQGGSLGSGRYPSQAASGAGAPALPGAGGAPSYAPGPGANEDVAAYKAAQAAIPSGQTAVQSLQKAQHALELASTGKSTAGMHDIYSYLVAQGVAPQGMTDDVKNYDIAHKYLLDYARQQGAAAHSDLQLNTSTGANASTDAVSNAAALDVVKTNIGRERQKIAQVMAAPNSNGIGYGAHAADFSNSTDPRAFAADQYTPKELKDMTSKMSPQELSKFHHSLEVANQFGLIKTQRN